MHGTLACMQIQRAARANRGPGETIGTKGVSTPREKMSRSRTGAYIEAIATVLIWGATFVATKIALREVSPATVVWVRFAMGLVVLGVAAGLRHELAVPRRGDWTYLALLGFNGVALHQWLQSNGLLTAQATTTAWIVASTPIFIALLGWFSLKERLSLAQGGGMAIAAIGVTLVVSRGDPSALLAGSAATMGDLLILLSALNWAIYTIVSRRMLSRLAAANMIFYVMVFGWLFVTVWIIGFGPGLGEIGLISLRGWAAISGLGVLGSGLAYIMYYDALKVLPASQLGAFLYVEPLVTMLLAAPVLGEPITAVVLAGGAMIIAGIYFVNHSGASAADDPAKITAQDRES
jgi:drug/metabolite transporter (DMT)-like permease